MFKFSEKSRSELDTCEEQLQWLFETVLKKYDCSILEGHRGKKKQNTYYRTKKSRKMFPDSKHNSEPSRAVDVAPYPIDWDDTKRFYHFAGYVKAVADLKGINIRWGGDWDNDNDLNDQKFMDLVHFELVN